MTISAREAMEKADHSASGASVNSPVPDTSIRPVSGFVQAQAVFAKDLRSELRNRTALNSLLLFAIVAVLVVGFAVGAGGSGLAAPIKAALLWVVLFFGAFAGLAHVFLHEEEASTVMALRLTAAPGAVYAGKLLFNLLLLGMIVLVVVPLFLILLDLKLMRPFAFLAVILSGCVGLGAAATIVAAIIAKARGKGALYGALGLPLLLPLLIMAVRATQEAMVGDGDTLTVLRGVGGLISFAVMLITASALLFPFVWED